MLVQVCLRRLVPTLSKEARDMQEQAWLADAKDRLAAAR